MHPTNVFTSTSPSVYVVYSQLGATVSATGTCPQGLPVETVGPYFEAYTTGYANSFLAYGTLEIEGPGCTEDVIVGGFHTIDFSNLYYNPISPSTTYKAGCAPYVNPRVSMVLDLTAAIPAWATCQPLYYGAFDPPSILHKESQLVPSAGGPGQVTNVGPATPTEMPAKAPAAPTFNDPAPTQTPAPVPASNSFHSAPQLTPAKAGPVDTPPNPPADPISAPGNPAAQANPIPPDVPGNSPATTPTKPQDPPPNASIAPSTDPGQPAPKNTLYNPNSLNPEQVTALDQALGNNIPGPPNPAPNDPTTTSPAPENPASNNPAPNNPAPAPIPLQTIPNNPPAAGGNPAPQATTQLQTLPINPPPNPGQPPNNGNYPPSGGNGNVDPPQPAATNNGPPQPGKKPGPTFPAEAPAVALPIATAPVYLGMTQPLAIGGQAVQKAPDGGLLIGGQSIAQGSQATVAGQIVSVGASNVAVGSSTYALPTAVGPNPVALGTLAPLSIGGQAAQYAPGPNGGLLIAGQTIAAGQEATVSGSVISVGASALNIDGSTYGLPAPTAATAFGQPAPPAVGGHAMQQAPGGGVIIAGQTIAQGSQAIVQGTAISVSSSSVIIARTSYPIPGPTVDGHPLHQAPNGAVIIASQTIPPGSQTTISSTIISAPPTGIIIAGSSYTLSTPAFPLEYISLPFSIGNAPITQLPSSALLIADQTLTPGITTTISGTGITLGTGTVVLDDSTFFLPSLTGSAPALLRTPAPLLIAGTYASDAPSGGGIILAGATILPGTQTTISGTTISIPSTGAAVIVNGVSYPLLNPTHAPTIRTTLPLAGSVTALPVVSEKAGLAGIIYSALGGNGSSGNATRMSTSIDPSGFTTPSGTMGGSSSMPSTFIAKSEAVGLREYSALVVILALLVGLS